ncbi:diaminopimelate epimerase [Fibrella sp. HMF5335]|uniref:Diaminopimelate epimerase n=1 Tax=Fibrella rubiginis TaxID=2817060 RepID=A0A939GLV5_9BACT|nr:diaminopimelate epimerase [Fibrella rubiginis]MBO0938807.1 diaminopimelate epimerase [Fibrella rubiginis]
MHFFKYQGTGNDFVMIDDRARTFPAADQALVARLCHRHFGIGADGLILLQTDPDGTLRMVYFNADGAEGSMCGNGGRCFVRFAHDLGLITNQVRFMAVDGEHEAQVQETDVHLRMGDVADIEHQAAFSFLNTGSPHVVQFEDDVTSLDVVAVGRPLRYAAQFSPGGTNVNFVESGPDQTLFVRTYERGVEDETYSCGTGVTAAALVAHQQLGLASPVAIRTLGGALRVAFEAQLNGTFGSIYLIGPAQRVFEGDITV